MNRKRLKQ